MTSQSVSNFLCGPNMTRDYKIVPKKTRKPHFYFHSLLLTKITCSVWNQWLRENNPPPLSKVRASLANSFIPLAVKKSLYNLFLDRCSDTSIQCLPPFLLRQGQRGKIGYCCGGSWKEWRQVSTAQSIWLINSELAGLTDESQTQSER